MLQIRVKIAAFILLSLFYAKFVLSIILKYEGPEIFYMDILSYLMCLLAIDYRRINYSIFIVVAFLLITVFTTSARTFAFLVITLYALKDINLRYIAWLNVFFSLLVFLFAWGAIQLNVVEDRLTVIDDKYRYDFGFSNPNMLAVFSLGLIANLYVLIAKYSKVITLIVLGSIAYWVTFYSGSRTFGVAVIVILVYYMFQDRYSTKSPKYKIIKLLPVIIVALTLLCAFVVRVVPAVDVLFSFRLSLYNQLLSQTPPWGYIIGNSLVDEITIDSSYMHMIFRAGIGGFILFYYLYLNTINKIDNQNRYMLPLLVGMVLYATTESYLLFTLIYNNMIIWLFLFKNGFRDRVKLKENIPPC